MYILKSIRIVGAITIEVKKLRGMQIEVKYRKFSYPRLV